MRKPLAKGVDAVLEEWRKVRLKKHCRTPSRLERHRSLSSALGIDLWIKREDVIDEFGCGHKARKMRYVGADALAAGATVLVTAASLPSSQAVALAVTAKRLGMRAHIVYCGDRQERPSSLRGNYLLMALFGPTITWKERAQWDDWPCYVEDVMRKERANGERPYLVPPGLSQWPGLLGSVELGVELARQIGTGREAMDVVGAAGSGGSLLGLSIGLRASGSSARTHGICIGTSLEAVERNMAALREDAAVHLPVMVVADSTVELHDGARGAGYDAPTIAEFETIRMAAVDHRLLLDPTYMAKTVNGLRQLVAASLIPKRRRVVLVHTGGTFGLLGGSDPFDDWAGQQTSGPLG